MGKLLGEGFDRKPKHLARKPKRSNTLSFLLILFGVLFFGLVCSKRRVKVLFFWVWCGFVYRV